MNPLIAHGREAIERGRHRTPVLFTDQASIICNLEHFARVLPRFTCRYGLQHNNSLAAVHAAADAGARLAISDLGDLALLESNGVDLLDVLVAPDVKAAEDIIELAAHGVTWFAASSLAEVAKILDVAPMSSVLVRVDEFDAIAVDESVELLQLAQIRAAGSRGLRIDLGDLTDVEVATSCVRRAVDLVRAVQSAIDAPLDLLEVGCAFPDVDRRDHDRHGWASVGELLEAAVSSLAEMPRQLVVDPGPAVVASAGVLLTRVVGIDMRRGERRVHIDAGEFGEYLGGLAMDGDGTDRLVSFDREIEVLESAVLVNASTHGGGGGGVIASDALLPVDLEVGELVALAGAGASLPPTGPVWSPAPAPSTVHRKIVRSAATGDVPGYEVVLPGDAAFEHMCELEFQSFAESGFLEEDGTLSSCRKLDPVSRFIVVPNAATPMGVVRMLDATPHGFLTLTDMDLYAETHPMLHSINLSSAAECATLAPLEQKPVTSVHLLRALLHDCDERNMSHLLCSLDAEWLDSIEGRYFKSLYSLYRLGPPIDYVGSPTVPLLLDLHEVERSVGFQERLAETAARFPMQPSRSQVAVPA